MPILEVEVVESRGSVLPADAARLIADGTARVFELGAGRVWVKLRPLCRSHYAENDVELGEDLAPVFVRVLEAVWPTGTELEERMSALSQVIASVLGRPGDQVHVLYDPPAAGRIAFGGRIRR